MRAGLGGRESSVVLDGVGGELGRAALELLGPFARGYSLLFDADGLPADGPMIDVTAYDPSALWAMGNIVSHRSTSALRALLGGSLLPRVSPRS